MGFFENLGKKAEEVMAKNYHNATGRNYQRDFQTKREVYEYKEDFELLNAWDSIRDDRSATTLPERMALRSILQERNIEFDEFD